MGKIHHFVAGEPDVQTGFWRGLFDPPPAEVVRAYLQANTQPGDLVLDPFCCGGAVLRQAIDAGRRAIGSSFDPLAVRLTRLTLGPPTRRQLDAAVTRLGSSPRMGTPFLAHIEALYAVRCPRCGEHTPADAFVWERESSTVQPVDWQCRRCGHEGVSPSRGGSESPDEIAGRQGPHYWHLVDRIAPAGDPLRDRTQHLLELYTPRNLYALTSLLLKIESLFAGEMEQTLKLLLLRCLDTCSSLHVPDTTPRYRLRPPAHFVERNVWRAFVAAADAFPAAESAPVFLSDDPETILTRTAPGAALLPLGVHRLIGVLPHGHARMILATPPQPDPAVWALSWLWTGWLFGRLVAEPFRPLLQQWRVDWNWYSRTMMAAFRALRALLVDGGTLVLAFDNPDPAQAEALALALAGAGYAPTAWIQQSDTHVYRLASRCASLPAPPPEIGELTDDLYRETSAAVRHLIAAHGEPVTGEALQLPLYQHLTDAGLLGQVAVTDDLEVSPRAWVAKVMQETLVGMEELVALGQDLDTESLFWWLKTGSPSSPPLSTRVEAAVHQMLLSHLILTEAALFEGIYRRFPGHLTPDRTLVATCLRSWGRQITPGHWQLRPEDQPERRDAEMASIRRDLGRLGQRLGFEVVSRPEAASPARPAFDLLWQDEGRPAYAFAIQWTARVHDLLLAELPPGVQPCLVLPGGRAELVIFKMQRDPRLRRAASQGNWQFIKYRHLRRMMSQKDTDRHAFRQILGLDPIIERDGAQMPLF